MDVITIGQIDSGVEIFSEYDGSVRIELMSESEVLAQETAAASGKPIYRGPTTQKYIGQVVQGSISALVQSDMDEYVPSSVCKILVWQRRRA